MAVTKEQLRAARDAALDCIGSLDPLRVNILATVKGWKEARGKSSARGLDEVEAIISEDCAKLSSLAERYEKQLLPEIAEAIEVANTETIDAAIDAWNDQCTTWHAGVLAHTKYYLFSVRECVVPPNNSQGRGKKDRIAHIEGLPSRLNDINRLSPGRLEAHVRRECAHVLRAIERAHKMEQGEKSAEETARAIARNVKGVTGFAIPSCDFPNPSAPMSQSRAAQVLEVSDDTIRRLRNNGKLRFRRLSRQLFIFCLDDAPKLASA